MSGFSQDKFLKAANASDKSKLYDLSTLKALIKSGHSLEMSYKADPDLRIEPSDLCNLLILAYEYNNVESFKYIIHHKSSIEELSMYSGSTCVCSSPDCTHGGYGGILQTLSSLLEVRSEKGAPLYSEQDKADRVVMIYELLKLDFTGGKKFFDGGVNSYYSQLLQFSLLCIYKVIINDNSVFRGLKKEYGLEQLTHTLSQTELVRHVEMTRFCLPFMDLKKMGVIFRAAKKEFKKSDRQLVIALNKSITEAYQGLSLLEPCGREALRGTIAKNINNIASHSEIASKAEDAARVIAEKTAKLKRAFSETSTPKQLTREILSALTTKGLTDDQKDKLILELVSLVGEHEDKRPLLSSLFDKEPFLHDVLNVLDVSSSEDLFGFFVSVRRAANRHWKDVEASEFDSFRKSVKLARNELSNGVLPQYATYEKLFISWNSFSLLDGFLRCIGKEALIPTIEHGAPIQKAKTVLVSGVVSKATQERERKAMARIAEQNKAAAAAKEAQKERQRKRFEEKQKAKAAIERQKLKGKASKKPSKKLAKKEARTQRASKSKVCSTAQTRVETYFKGAMDFSIRPLSRKPEEVLVIAPKLRKNTQKAPRKEAKISLDMFVVREHLDAFKSEFAGIEHTASFESLTVPDAVKSLMIQARRVYMLISLNEAAKYYIEHNVKPDESLLLLSNNLRRLRNRLAHSQSLSWEPYSKTNGRVLSLHNYLALVKENCGSDESADVHFEIDIGTDKLNEILAALDALKAHFNNLSGKHKKSITQICVNEPELIRSAKGLIIQMHHCLSNLSEKERKKFLNKELKSLLKLRNCLAHESETEIVESYGAVPTNLKHNGIAVNQLIVKGLMKLPSLGHKSSSTPFARAGAGGPSPKEASLERAL